MAVKTKKKISRNAPCMCGSGKKYKHCCLLDGHNALKVLNRFLDQQTEIRTPVPHVTNRVSRFALPPVQRSVVSWKHLFCQVPLKNGKFYVLTVAYSSDFVERNELKAGQFLRLDLEEIQFHDTAFIIAIRDTPVVATREGELLVAMKRSHEGDFGIMIYGKGKVAEEVLNRRRESSRHIVLEMEKPDGGKVDIELDRFVDWIEAHGAEVGKEIFLELPEMGARGFARVIEIKPLPPVSMKGSENINSRRVTGRFRHSSGDVYDLKLAAESEPLGVTGTHPFWSVDRREWVFAVDLRIGETLKTLDGTTTAESRTKRPHPEPVYNIEVEGEHVYRVGESGVLVHNASKPCEKAGRTATYGGKRKLTFKDTSGKSVKITVGTSASVVLTPSNVGPRTGDLNSPKNWNKLKDVAGSSIEIGHILASTLGGKNDDHWENFTPLYANANAPAMSTCEGFLKKLVTECGYCVNVNINVQGYGSNVKAPEEARPAMPNKVVITWTTDDGCQSGVFTIKNSPSATTLDKCRVKNLPCRQ